MAVTNDHTVLKTPLSGPFPAPLEKAMFGLGCFWGAERIFWTLPGVYTTAVGYAAGITPNPTYYEVCTGQTGHNEVVLVVFDPTQTSYETLLTVFLGKSRPNPGNATG
jgi:peptide-methionine (S)-S-oxide reductase